VNIQLSLTEISSGINDFLGNEWLSEVDTGLFEIYSLTMPL